MNQLSDLSCCRSQPESVPLPRSRFHFSCSTMARFTTTIFLLIVILVVLLAIYAESSNPRGPNDNAKTRDRPHRRKKPQTTTTTTTPPPAAATTPLPALNQTTNDADTSTQEQSVTSPSSLVSPIMAALIESTTEEEHSTQKRSVAAEASEQVAVTVNPPSADTSDEDASAESITKRQPPRIVYTTHDGVKLPDTTKNVGCEHECDLEDCPKVDRESCPSGIVLDRCGCCRVCGASEGNRCTDPSLDLPYNPDIGVCGEGLICKLRSDLEPSDVLEALCQCRDPDIVCGSDNVTYPSECKLREAARTNPNLTVSARQPCLKAPWISTAVENITVSERQEGALTCEVKGFPAPTVHWEFKRVLSDLPSILPGDDSSLVVTVRGGPDRMMTTSWLQMVSVVRRRQGTYTCVATNSEGGVTSTGQVIVV